RRRHTRFSRDWSSDVCSSDLNLGKTQNCLRLHIYAGATWYVIKDLRNGNRLGNELMMEEQTFLSRLVVIGGHQQAGISTDIFGGGSQLDSLFGRVRTGTGNHRNPTVNLINDLADNFQMLFNVQGSRFARRPYCNDGMGALLQMPIHQLMQTSP